MEPAWRVGGIRPVRRRWLRYTGEKNLQLRVHNDGVFWIRFHNPMTKATICAPSIRPTLQSQGRHNRESASRLSNAQRIVQRMRSERESRQNLTQSNAV